MLHSRIHVVFILLCAVLRPMVVLGEDAHDGHNEQLYIRVAPAIVGLRCTAGTSETSGSGVIVSPTGLLLTTTTLLPGTVYEIKVFFQDKHAAKAVLLATDIQSECALLQIQGIENPLPFLQVAESKNVRLGEGAFTLGNPFDSITRDGEVAFSAGHVSGRYVVSNADEKCRYSGEVFETDAAVNPGSEGGALIDGKGRLLGIVSCAIDKTRRLGTAVPVHVSLANFDKLLGKVSNAESSTGALIASSLAVVKVFRGSNAECFTAGVIVDPEGFVLTCANGGFGKNEKVIVQLQDGAKCSASVSFTDVQRDIALLRITCAATLPSVSIGNVSPQPGDVIQSMGFSTLGLHPTVNWGMIAALHRFDGLAEQVDLKVNAGNYGGPVFDEHGGIVGIVTHFRPSNDYSQPNCGIGFITSGAEISRTMPSFLNHCVCTTCSKTACIACNCAATDQCDRIRKLQQSVVIVGEGSGVVVSSDGYMVTSNHICGDRTTWPVRVGTKTEVADLITTDASADLALLKIRDAHNFEFAELADSAPIGIGTSVIVAGDPYRLAADSGSPAFSRGVISALHQNQGKCRDVLQIDAAVNPGNSGGPVFSFDGKLIGITGQIRCRFDAIANTGIAFATSLVSTRRIIASIQNRQGLLASLQKP